MRTALQLLGRVVSPSALVLALLCFGLPFVAVSCDAPGGYGRVRQGGTTSYTGVDLATGGSPSVDRAALRPPGERRDDRTSRQPLAALAFVLALAGIPSALLLRRRRIRAEVTGGLALGAAAALVANQLVARHVIVERVAEQVAIPVGKSAADFVHTATGFWLCLLLLLVAAIAALIPALRREQAEAEPPGTGPARDVPPAS